ncbi:MAG: hemolysin family protein [Alphaproteobacteria bacterium]
MLMKTEEKEEPPSRTTSPVIQQGDVISTQALPEQKNSIFSLIKRVFKPKSDPTLRETIEEYIDDASEETSPSISEHEKTLLSNVLELRDMTAADVMIPRVDITAISHETTKDELFDMLSQKQFSRIPVYKETLDDVIGTIHIKDILSTLTKGEELKINELIRNVPIISPSLHVLDLLLQMRMSRKHMVLVVDEYGGIDGLITIGDVIEAIVGEIDDEYDPDEQPEIKQQIDGTYIADARYDLEEFEEMFGQILTGEERDENDTLGGLVFTISGRVPARGEVLTHSSGVIFEITDADPRRVNRVRIRNIPESI